MARCPPPSRLLRPRFGARAILVSDAKQRAKVREFRGTTPTLECVIAIEGDAEALEKENALAFSEVIKRGEAEIGDGAALDALIAPGKADDIATLIYTSGTTGDPKGAMLSHMAMLQTPDAVMDEPIAQVGPGDQFLSFLPLSHITERVGGYYLPLRAGACIVYSQGLSSIGEEITTTVRPHIMLCVPRIFENIYDKFKDSLAKMEPDMRKKVEWGLKIGTEAAERRSDGKGLGLVLGIAVHDRGETDPAENPREGDRRPHSVLRLRRRAAGPGDRDLLSGDRHPDPGRLRPLGDQHHHASTGPANSASEPSANSC